MKRIVMVLIATTFSISGILYYWGTNLVERTLAEAEEFSMETDCPSALFKFYSGSYNHSKEELVLILENKRSVDLRMENVYLFYPNGVMMDIPVNETLEGIGIESFRFLGIDDGFTNGRIKTNCPDVAVEFTYSQVT